MLIVLLLSMFSVGHAQRFVGYAAAGANFSQIEGDDVHGFTKVGANVGLGIKLPVNRSQTMSVTAELLYVQKGSYKRCSPGYFDTLTYAPVMFEDVNRNVPFNPKVKCNITLDYVQIPVLFRYEERNTGVTFGAGFSWSRLVRAKEVYNGFTRTTNLQSGTYKTSDWSVLADVDIRLYKNLSLGIRWEFSMVPIRTWEVGYVKGSVDNIEWETRNMRNHLLSARLCYYFNEKYERNTKTNNKGELIGTKWKKVIPEYN